jgi:hypothetical protein
MIVVRLVGRMGNQLFQYAFALSEQRRLGVYAVIDDRFMRDIVSDYFTVKGIHQHKLVKRLVFRFSRLPEIYQDGIEDVDDFFSRHITDKKYYYGYFQSERYFSSIRDEIKSRFRIKQRYRDEFELKYGPIFNTHKVLAIHYRFGDYVAYTREHLGGADFTLPQSYYQNALSMIPDLDSYFIILVTDDVEMCKGRTPYIKNKMVVSDSEILDFQILQNADLLITANSSFSWWAAYLNNKNAKPFVPEYWLGFKVQSEFPNSIIAGHYRKVKV